MRFKVKRPHPKYNIKEGDTLQKVTDLFGIEESIWKGYHNNMCRLDDIIRDTLPKHLEEIFLLPELWDKELNLSHISTNNEEVNHDTTRKVRVQNTKSGQKQLTNWAIYPRLNKLNHAYWFRYIIEDKKSVTEVKYKVLVRHIRQETEETDLYLINRISDVYINDELPNLCMDELAYETGKVFYTMVVEIDKKAQRVALRNYEQIKNKWINTIRPYVVLRYGGEVGNRYLTQMDKVIGDKNRIEEIFKNDLFIQLYFGTFYHSYSQEFEIDKTVEFSTGSTPSYFNVNCKLNRNFTEKGYKEIIQNGIGLSRCDTITESFVEDKDTTYSARILLEPITNYPREALVEWNNNLFRKKTRLILYPLRYQHNENLDIQIDKVEKKKSSLFRFFE